MISQREYDHLQKQQQALLEAINEASSSARTIWLFYLAAIAYLFLAISGVSHEVLLLNSPIQLPLFGTDVGANSFFNIEVAHFFLFGPAIFLLIQLTMLIQHMELHRKIVRFNQNLKLMEATDLPDGESYRINDGEELRFQLSSYFYTQRLAAPHNHTMLNFSIEFMRQITFLWLPMAVLLFFHAKFIPYHDEEITSWTRLYIIICGLMLIGMGLFKIRFITLTVQKSLGTRVMRFILLFTGFLTWAITYFAAMIVFTIPDSNIDCVVRLATGKLNDPATVQNAFRPDQVEYNSFIFAPYKTIRQHKKSIARCRAGLTKRSALSLTAYLSERRFDPGSGRQVNFFDRNLYVIDEKIIKTSSVILSKNGELTLGSDTDSISLRHRNLRYATLDRSILTGVDFTGADLKGASLRGTNLKGAKLTCDKFVRQQIAADLKKKSRFTASDTTDLSNFKFLGCADLQGANLEDADLEGADLRGANFKFAKLSRAWLKGVFAVSTDFTQAELSFANFDNAVLPRARFEYANLTEASMRNAKLRFAQFTGANLSRAKLQGTTLVLADLSGAHLKHADLEGSNLSHAQLPGANLYGANFTKADLSFAAMQGADLRLAQLKNTRLNGTQLSGVRAIAAKFHCADFNAANLQGADLRGAIFYGAKFDNETDISLSDLRFARYWQSIPPSKSALVDLWRSTQRVPASTSQLSMRQEICRMYDYHVGAGNWYSKHQARIGKIDKCLKLAKNLTGQPIDVFLKELVVLRGADVPYLSGTPYNCSYLESGLKNAGTDNWSSSEDSKNWMKISTQSSNENSTIRFSPKALSHKLIDLICTEKPHASYIVEGVIKRIVERIPSMDQPKKAKKTTWLTFQGDAGEFLTKLEKTEGCAKTLREPLRGSLKQLMWQLRLAVEVDKREKALQGDGKPGSKRAAN